MYFIANSPLSPNGRSIELPSWPVGGIARFRLARLFRKKTALFRSSDSTMSPQSFQDHFRRRCRCTLLFAVGNTQAVNMLHQSLDTGKLAVALLRRILIGNFQFAAQFKPLDNGLKVCCAESFG